MLLLGRLNSNERDRFRTYTNALVARLDPADPHYGRHVRELELAVYRDIQAQRLPPNVRVPSRRQPMRYLATVRNSTGSWPLAVRSYLSPGSWTSSGGSFRLAEKTGFDLVAYLMDCEQTTGSARLLEVGAGYAGLRSGGRDGIGKLVTAAGRTMGDTVFAHFTNLTPWHGRLPEGVIEHPGYAARDVHLLQDVVGPVNVVYSQCAAYFEPNIGRFIDGAESMLTDGGMLIFNARPSVGADIAESADRNGLQGQTFELGEENGTVHVLHKKMFPAVVV